jgi:hypothetical protein
MPNCSDVKTIKGSALGFALARTAAPWDNYRLIQSLADFTDFLASLHPINSNKFESKTMKSINLLFSKLAAGFRQLVPVALLATVSACSTVQGLGEFEHGLSVANKGDTKIFNVVIQYGKITRKECVPLCHPKSGGGVWNAPMPVPDTAQVSWETADGQKHQVTVPVRTRVKDLRRLRNLYFQFNGDQLVVIQGLDYNNPTIFEYEKFHLFP